MATNWRRRPQESEAAERLRIVNDGAAAQLIRNMNFDPARITEWVQSHPTAFDLTFVRFGGVARILAAAKLLERDNPHDINLAKEEKWDSGADIWRHAWRILAMADGVIDHSGYNSRMGGLVESFGGSAFIPFPSGRRVHATGFPESWNDPSLVRTGYITYAEV